MQSQYSCPEDYRAAELSACTMLCFYSEPCENGDNFCEAIEAACAAVDPAQYGCRIDIYGLHKCWRRTL